MDITDFYDDDYIDDDSESENGKCDEEFNLCNETSNH